MANRKAVFYIGRVVKIGISQDEFIKTMLNSRPYDDGIFKWNIVNVQENEIDNTQYYCGKLNKAKPDAMVKVMVDEYKTEIEKEEPDLIVCSSEFIYIPKYSGIAFHSIPCQIEPRKFIKIFKEIIENTHEYFFVECSINLIDDLETFVKKLKRFDTLTVIKASVNPPNPMFGRFWESLKKYLQERNAEEVSIKEANRHGALSSNILDILELLLIGDEQKINQYLKNRPISPADAAILMSMDGYGTGRIDGKVDGQNTFIKTHERTIHITASQDDIEEIFLKTNAQLKRIKDERHMEH
jgi:hypothetical protein